MGNGIRAKRFRVPPRELSQIEHEIDVVGTPEIEHRLDDTIAAFLPTTPNPTSGFLLFVKRSEVIVLDMSLEDAAKLVISAGLVAPEYPPDPDSKGRPRPGIRP